MHEWAQMCWQHAKATMYVVERTQSKATPFCSSEASCFQTSPRQFTALISTQHWPKVSALQLPCKQEDASAGVTHEVTVPMHDGYSQYWAVSLAVLGLHCTPEQKFDASFMSSQRPSYGTFSCHERRERASHLLVLALFIWSGNTALPGHT